MITTQQYQHNNWNKLSEIKVQKLRLNNLKSRWTELTEVPATAKDVREYLKGLEVAHLYNDLDFRKKTTWWKVIQEVRFHNGRWVEPVFQGKFTIADINLPEHYYEPERGELYMFCRTSIRELLYQHITCKMPDTLIYLSSLEEYYSEEEILEMFDEYQTSTLQRKQRIREKIFSFPISRIMKTIWLFTPLSDEFEKAGLDCLQLEARWRKYRGTPSTEPIARGVYPMCYESEMPF